MYSRNYPRTKRGINFLKISYFLNILEFIVYRSCVAGIFRENEMEIFFGESKLDRDEIAPAEMHTTRCVYLH